MYRRFTIISLMMFGCVAPAIVTPPEIIQKLPIPSVSSILESTKPYTPTPFPAPSPTATTNTPKSRKHIQVIIVSIGDKEWDNNVRLAISEWNQALGFEAFRETYSSIKLIITYENRASETNMFAVGAYNRNRCVNSTIKLFKNLTRVRQRTVILHELGHALGLGHSEYPNDIMYSSVSSSTRLSDNDIKRALLSKIHCI